MYIGKIASVFTFFIVSVFATSDAEKSKALAALNNEEEDSVDMHMPRRLGHSWGFGYSTIESFVIRNGRFSTLESLLVAADLVGPLADATGEFTLFAPTNYAFSKLPPALVADLQKPEFKEVLQQVLLYHVVPQTIYSSDISCGATSGVPTLASNDMDTIDVHKYCYWWWWNSISIDSVAHVVRTDIRATNGVVHVINNVLVPPSLSETVASYFDH